MTWHRTFSVAFLRPMTCGLAVGLAVAASVSGPATAADHDTRTVRVRTTAQLQSALADAQPGDTVELAAGVYRGNFTMKRSGTQSSPITIRGPRKAVLRGASVESGYVLHLDGAHYVRVEGLTVSTGNKAIVLDQSSHNTLSNLDVVNSGNELVLIRNYSSSNIVERSRIHKSGQVEPGYGEGVYIGLSHTRWNSKSSRTQGAPDTSDGNIIRGNTIYDTTAECIDVKEGTSSGQLVDNTLHGGSMTGDNYADSWVDIAGNNYLVSGNVGKGDNGTLSNGFETHVQLPGWGQGNEFTNNRGALLDGRFGIYIHKRAANIVRPSNRVDGVRDGLTNMAVTG